MTAFQRLRTALVEMTIIHPGGAQQVIDLLTLSKKLADHLHVGLQQFKDDKGAINYRLNIPRADHTAAAAFLEQLGFTVSETRGNLTLVGDDLQAVIHMLDDESAEINLSKRVLTHADDVPTRMQKLRLRADPQLLAAAST